MGDAWVEIKNTEILKKLKITLGKLCDILLTKFLKTNL